MARVLSLAPSLSRLRQRVFGERSIYDLANERIELAPASATEALPLIALPGEFDRVLEVEEHTDFATQRHWIDAPFNEHPATTTYRFDRAVLGDGTVYVGWKDHLLCHRGPKRPILWSEAALFDQAHLCTNIAATTVFAHWVRDATLLELLAEQRGLTPLSFATQTWPHEPGYRALFDLPGTQVSAAIVRNLWITDDRGLNNGWADRFRELRRRLRAKAVALPGPHPSHVYICRGQTGTARELMNAGEIKDVLLRKGFTVIEPEKMAPEDIAATLAHARVAVSVEGSALNHAQLALPTGSAILTIQPPRRFNAFHRHFTDIGGLRFGYVVADPVEQGFTLEPDRLFRTLDKVEAAI